MKLAVRVLLGTFALLLLAALALAVALPRIAQRPAVRERIARAALQATGRELRFAELDAGILPPRLIVASPELVAREGDAPLRADRVALSLGLLPLLTGRVAVDTLTLEGADLSFARTPDGFELPVELAAPQAEADSSLELTVAEVRVTDSRVALADRLAVPETVWQLEDVDARAGGSLTGRVTFDASAKLASGGELSASGKLLDGELGVQVELAKIALAAAKAYLPKDASAAGEANLELQLSGKTDALSGPIELDLDAAQLEFEDSFAKPAGEKLRIAGTLALIGDEVALQGGSLALRDLETPLEVTMAERTSARLAGGSLELEGWAAILPALEGLGLTGKLSFQNLAIGMDPLSLRGVIELDGVALPLGEGESAVVSLKLEGSGDAIRGSGPVTVGGQRIPLELGITRLSRELQLELAARAEDLDSGAFASAFGAPKASISGPLDLDAKLSAPLAGEAALVDALSGPIAFTIAPGRLPGISLFRQVIDALGGVASVGALFGKLGSGGVLEAFYDDEFESLGGTFRLANGKAHTDDLALLYRDYRVDLTGDVALADTALDLEGKLTIFEAIDRALAGAAQPAEAASERAVKRELTLAHVGGTASAPSVKLSPAGALAFATEYLGSGILRGTLDTTGSGVEGVVDALGGLLGGKKKKAEPE